MFGHTASCRCVASKKGAPDRLDAAHVPTRFGGEYMVCVLYGVCGKMRRGCVCVCVWDLSGGECGRCLTRLQTPPPVGVLLVLHATHSRSCRQAGAPGRLGRGVASCRGSLAMCEGICRCGGLCCGGPTPDGPHCLHTASRHSCTSHCARHARTCFGGQSHCIKPRGPVPRSSLLRLHTYERL